MVMRYMINLLYTVLITLLTYGVYTEAGICTVLMFAIIHIELYLRYKGEATNKETNRDI